MNTYTILLAGDGGVGKTTWVHRCKNNNHLQKAYVPTLGVDKSYINIQGNAIELHDMSGQEKFSLIRQGSFTEGDIAIIMLDLSNSNRLIRSSFDFWHRLLRSTLPDIPIVIVLNKIDYSRRPIVETKAYVRTFSSYPIILMSALYEEMNPLSLLLFVLKQHPRFQHKKRFTNILSCLSPHGKRVKHGGSLDFCMTYIHWYLNQGIEAEEIYKKLDKEVIEFFGWQNGKEVKESVDYWYTN